MGASRGSNRRRPLPVGRRAARRLPRGQSDVNPGGFAPVCWLTRS